MRAETCAGLAMRLQRAGRAAALIGAGRLQDCSRGRSPDTDRRIPGSWLALALVSAFQGDQGTSRVCRLGITFNWKGFK